MLPCSLGGSGCLVRRRKHATRHLPGESAGRSSTTWRAAELPLSSRAVVLPLQRAPAVATRLPRLCRDVEVREPDFLRTPVANPTRSPRRYACRMPEGDRRPSHIAVRQPHEVYTICPADGRDVTATKNTYSRRRRRLRRVVVREGAQRVIPHGPSHGIFAREPRWHRDAFALARRSNLCIMSGGLATRGAVRASAVSAQRAQQFRGSGSLDSELGEGADVHVVTGLQLAPSQPQSEAFVVAMHPGHECVTESTAIRVIHTERLESILYRRKPISMRWTHVCLRCFRNCAHPKTYTATILAQGAQGSSYFPQFSVPLATAAGPRHGHWSLDFRACRVAVGGAMGLPSSAAVGALLTLLGLVVLGCAVGSGRRAGFVGAPPLERGAHSSLGDRSVGVARMHGRGRRVGTRRTRGRSEPIPYRAPEQGVARGGSAPRSQFSSPPATPCAQAYRGPHSPRRPPTVTPVWLASVAAGRVTDHPRVAGRPHHRGGRRGRLHT